VAEMTSFWMTCQEKRGATCHSKTCESSNGNVKNKCHVSAHERFKRHVCPMTRVHEFFRIYRELLSLGFGVLGFLLFRLVGTSEARSSEATVRDLLFKTQAAPKLRRSLGSFDQIKETHRMTDIVSALLLNNNQ
jgi:hypothetical protein